MSANLNTVLAFSGRHVAAITTKGSVVCWGRNVYNECVVPWHISERIVSVSCGSTHTTALTQTGKLHYWGEINSHLNDITYKQVVSAGEHIVGLTTDGELMCFGNVGFVNSETALGHAQLKFSQFVDYRATRLFSNGECAVALDSENRLHNIIGNNLLLTEADTPYLQFSSPVVDVSFGAKHTAVLCENGRAYIWGDNDYGQLEFPADLTENRLVVSLECAMENYPDSTRRVVAIGCGFWHTILTLSDGAVVYIGRKYNADYHKDMDANLLACFENTDMRKINALSCNTKKCFTDYWSCVLLTDDADGMQRFGDYGHYYNKDCRVTPAEWSTDIVDVRIGQHVTFALTRQGKLYGWGDEAYTELDIPSDLVVDTAGYA